MRECSPLSRSPALPLSRSPALPLSRSPALPLSRSPALPLSLSLFPLPTALGLGKSCIHSVRGKTHTAKNYV
jgi:hypothetical protein